MRLYIGNLSYDAAEDDLRQAFSPIGPLGEVLVVRDRETRKSKGFGFVDFEDPADGRRAVEQMDGKSLLGRVVRVNEARPKERSF